MFCRQRSVGRGLAAAIGFFLLGLAPHRATAAAPLGDVVAFGAYAHGLPYYDDAFLDLEKKLGAKLDIASGFIDFEYVLGEERDLKLASGGDRVLLYSWEPHC